MKRFIDISLSKQFGIFFLLIFCVPLIMLGFFLYLEFQNIQKTNLKEFAFVAKLQAHELESALQPYDRAWFDLDRNEGLRNALSSQKIQSVDETLQRLATQQPLVREILLLDRSGNVMYTTDEASQTRSFASRIFFEKGKGRFGLHETEQESETLVGYFAGPYKVGSWFEGVLVMQAELSPVIEMQKSFSALSRTGELLLVAERDGQVFLMSPTRFPSKARTEGKRLSEITFVEVRALNTVPSVHDGVKDYRDMEVFAATEFLPTYQWGLVVKKDRDEVLVPLVNFYKIIVFSLLVSFGLILLVGMYLRRYILRPILQLTDLAHAIRSGKYRGLSVAPAKNEIGTLSQAFDQMSAKLIEANQTLERRVKERTHELHETLRKDEALLSSIGEGMLATDRHGRVMLVNEAAQAMFDWKIAGVVGKPVTEVVRLRRKGKAIAPEAHPAMRTLKHRQRLIGASYDAQRTDQEFPALVTSTPVLLGDKLIGAIMIVRDITKEKEVDRMKSEFISIASHQLRSPLTSLKWYSQLLASQKGLKKDERTAVERINTATERLIQLVNEFLTVSRLEEGEIPVRKTSVRLNELVKSILTFYKPLSDEHRVRLRSSVHLSRKTLETDEEMLREVCENLIGNAIKYSPEGSSVHVSLSEQDHQVVFMVEDHGPGIPKDEQPHIFSKFYRASNIVKKGFDGTGLGLYTAKHLIDRLGGTIGFRSDEKGSTFWVKLPIT